LKGFRFSVHAWQGRSQDFLKRVSKNQSRGLGAEPPAAEKLSIF